MSLGILQHGIVHRREDGNVTILRPGKRGGAPTEIAVPHELADAYRLATGDIVAGATEPISDEIQVEEAGAEGEFQFDNPPERTAENQERPVMVFPTECLLTITGINGLTLEEAEDRPFARTRRSHSERTPPERLLAMAVGPNDITGRLLDFAAPLGAGCMGVIQGPHGSGLTRTLRSALQGIVTHAPDCVVIVLLLRARDEEITDWRRRFPQVDFIVCPAAPGEATRHQTLRIADLLLEAAQRQTEMGKDVALLLDSLTGLWGAMLETEEAEAQAEADRSLARQRIVEWVRKAGCFHGEGPLGGTLGGSLTILGTVWHQETDIEEEEDRELHPHLRLMEHLIPELSWRVVLTETLAGQRLYPAIDVRACSSRYEDRLLPPERMEALQHARNALPRRDPLTAYHQLTNALDASDDLYSPKVQ